jgi:ATP-dependent helicase HrpB
MTMPDLSQLPIDSLLPEIVATLEQQNELILEAEPGAGKTTRVPLALLDQPWLAGQKIILLEPRRLAAKAAAQRLAQQLGEPVGKRVGYRVRLETRTSEATRLEVVTGGVLVRMLQENPGLEGIGLLILDEFHERSLDADLSLALALQGRELLREGPPLKLLLMSATLEHSTLSARLDGAPVVQSSGRSHPVEIIWSARSRSDEPIEPRIAKLVAQALQQHAGSLLVFLPGLAEIRRTQALLEPLLEQYPELLLTPLHGELPLDQQQQAILSPPRGQRKVVLATAIAETSLTIEGIEAVIDSGLSRQARFDPASGMTRLFTTRVSMASATQRAGRAGRLGPGTCYRLWSEAQHSELEPQTRPEILQADLAPLALQLLNWGVNDPAELIWLEPPPAATFSQAIQLLMQLEAIEAPAPNQLRLTRRGERMADLPTHPRLAHMLLCGAENGLLPLAADLAVLLTERDPLNTQSADLRQRLDWLQSAGREPQRRRLQQLASQLRSSCSDLTCGPDRSPDQPHWIGYLIACAYPDRIARQREPGSAQYRLSQGRGVTLAEQDPLRKHEWLAIATLSSHDGRASDRIRLACMLDPSLFESQLEDLKQTEEVVEWDSRQDRFVAERQVRIGNLVLSRAQLQEVTAEHRRRAIVSLLQREGLLRLSFTPEVEQFRARVAFAASQDSDAQWPDLSDAGLLQTLEQWLSPWLDTVTRQDDLTRLDLLSILRNRLDWPQQQLLDQLAPERIPVPSGSSYRIDYSQSPPVLAVKLQEMFGCLDTPRVGHGIPLTLHLLSPAQRPLQVTSDLAAFWAGSYREVKKEMKGRYPKHPWPDDPANAAPTRYTKRRQPS